MLTKGELSHSATLVRKAVMAALAALDTPDLHLQDTLTAGVPACDVEAVRILVTEGPERAGELAAIGAKFDMEKSSRGDELLLAARAVIHSRGLYTPVATPPAPRSNALVEAVQDSDIDVREGWFAIELLTERDRCTGHHRTAPRR